ncbi:hypothetical protein [Cellulomonas hominis]|uniref:hypothetical protein n=1 Tax=Cellulomonas hominis TaxID=156981 RepID=UPI001B9966AB|nr:hypothetical protein [Cellulomonas hominis]VTR75866.1 hypothetical protein CHMI_00619 [Cellulomonas hominis]
MRTRPRPFRAARHLAVASLLVLVAACSPAAEPDPPADTGGERLATSLTALFEQELEDAELSEFERDVFERAVATGEISDADYEEAFARFDRCVRDLGYEQVAEKASNGIYRITPPDLADEAAVEEYLERTGDCAEHTTMRIEALYAQQQVNPDLLADPAAVAAGCLVDLGAVPADYDAEAFERDFDGDLDAASFDAQDPEVQACLHGAGYAVAAG